MLSVVLIKLLRCIMFKKIAFNLALVSSLVFSGAVTAAAITSPSQYVFNDKDGDTDFDSDDYFNPNYSYTLSANQFDDNGGAFNLLSVTLTLSGFMEGRFELENTSADSGSEVEGLIASLLALSTSTGIDLVTVLPEFAFERSFTAYDGAIDFNGTSGDIVSASPVPVTDSETVTITDASILALFIGTSTIDLDVDGESNSTLLTDGGSVLNLAKVSSAGTLDIFYTYENASVRVSSPSTIMLFGLSLALISLRTFRRYKV